MSCRAILEGKHRLAGKNPVSKRSGVFFNHVDKAYHSYRSQTGFGKVEEFMTLEIGVWRIDNGLKSVEFGRLDIEKRLEKILDENIDIASPNWLMIRLEQFGTDHGYFIDLLALDRDANLIVIELKER